MAQKILAGIMALALFIAGYSRTPGVSPSASPADEAAITKVPAASEASEASQADTAEPVTLTVAVGYPIGKIDRLVESLWKAFARQTRTSQLR